MKVNAVNDNSKFRPVKLSIMIETKKELELLQTISGHNATVSNLMKQRGNYFRKR